MSGIAVGAADSHALLKLVFCCSVNDVCVSTVFLEGRGFVETCFQKLFAPSCARYRVL